MPAGVLDSLREPELVGVLESAALRYEESVLELLLGVGEAGTPLGTGDGPLFSFMSYGEWLGSRSTGRSAAVRPVDRSMMPPARGLTFCLPPVCLTALVVSFVRMRERDWAGALGLWGSGALGLWGWGWVTRGNSR